MLDSLVSFVVNSKHSEGSHSSNVQFQPPRDVAPARRHRLWQQWWVRNRAGFVGNGARVTARAQWRIWEQIFSWRREPGVALEAAPTALPAWGLSGQHP